MPALLPKFSVTRNGHGENKLKFRVEMTLDSIVTIAAGFLVFVATSAWGISAAYSGIKSDQSDVKARIEILERDRAAYVPRQIYEKDREVDAKTMKALEDLLNEIRGDVKELRRTSR